MKIELDYKSAIAYIKYEGLLVKLIPNNKGIISFISIESLRELYNKKLKFIFRGNKVWLDIKH